MSTVKHWAEWTVSILYRVIAGTGGCVNETQRVIYSGIRARNGAEAIRKARRIGAPRTKKRVRVSQMFFSTEAAEQRAYVSAEAGLVSAPILYRSWEPQVQTTSCSPDAWTGNALRFRTKKESDQYGLDLSMRWTAVRDVRSIRSTDPVTYQIVDGACGSIRECSQCNVLHNADSFGLCARHGLVIPSQALIENSGLFSDRPQDVE